VFSNRPFLVGETREPVVTSILLDFQKRIAALEEKSNISGEVDVLPAKLVLPESSE
jgi:hypothetical protein